MKKKFQDIKVITILFINFLPTAQSLSLYAQLIQEITTSTSLSMQICKYELLPSVDFHFAIIEADVLLVTYQYTDI